MKQFPKIVPRMSRHQAASLNEVADTVSKVSLMGSGSIVGDGLPEENPPPIYPKIRITAVTAPSGGDDVLYRYSGNFVTMQDEPKVRTSDYVAMFEDTLDENGNVLQFEPFLVEQSSNNPHVPVDGSVVVDVFPGPEDVWLFVYNNGGISITDVTNNVTYNNITNYYTEAPIKGPGFPYPLPPIGGIIPPGSAVGGGSADIDFYREAGTATPTSGTPYTPLVAPGANIGQDNLAVGSTLQILAIPIIVPSSRTTVKVGVYCVNVNDAAFTGGTHAADKFQIAIYRNAGAETTSMYPGALLGHTGDIYPWTETGGEAEGFIFKSLSVALYPGVNWLCVNASNDDYDSSVPDSAASFGFACQALMPILGYVSSLDPDPTIADYTYWVSPFSWLGNYPHANDIYNAEGVADPHHNITFGDGSHPVEDTYNSWPATMPSAPHLQKYPNANPSAITTGPPAILVVLAP